MKKGEPWTMNGANSSRTNRCASDVAGLTDQDIQSISAQLDGRQREKQVLQEQLDTLTEEVCPRALHKFSFIRAGFITV